jgi:hypothetical protein
MDLEISERRLNYRLGKSAFRPLRVAYCSEPKEFAVPDPVPADLIGQIIWRFDVDTWDKAAPV